MVSAGNSGGNGVSNPANCPGAIGVTALRHVGDKVGYSDLGPEITISAPGGNCVTTTQGDPCLYPIMTTSNTGTTTPVTGAPGEAYTDSFLPSLGTSFSAPLVSGTVALMFSVHPSLTAAQVKAKLQSSARPFPTTGGSTASITTCTQSSTSQDECYCPNPGPGVTTLCGAGMLDARAAVQAVSGVQASISLTTTTPTAGQAVSLTSNSVLNAGQSIASYAWTDPQRRHHRGDDHRRQQRCRGRRLADGRGRVRDPADDDRQHRLGLGGDALGDGDRFRHDAAGIVANRNAVVGRRRCARPRLAAAPARRRALARARRREGARRPPQRGGAGRAQGLKLKARPPDASSLSVASFVASRASAPTTR